VVEPIKVTIELSPYASRQVRLLARLQGGTHTSAAKAMIDLGCSVATPRIDKMSTALAPPGDDVRDWQNQILEEAE
jgi:hypothetical protein